MTGYPEDPSKLESRAVSYVARFAFRSIQKHDLLPKFVIFLAVRCLSHLDGGLSCCCKVVPDCFGLLSVCCAQADHFDVQSLGGQCILNCDQIAP